MASHADRLSSLANSLHLLSGMGALGHLGADQCSTGGKGESAGRSAGTTEFDYQRQPIGQIGTKRGDEQGVDGNKKVKGRKRHLSVDVLGLGLDCHVTAANVADIKVAPVMWVWLLGQYERIAKILADQSYRSEQVAQRLQSAYNCILEISPRLGTGFVVEPWRWVVERTFAWLDNARALCRDYEGLPENHEGMVYVVMIRLMLRRLGNNRRTRKSKNP